MSLFSYKITLGDNFSKYLAISKTFSGATLNGDGNLTLDDAVGLTKKMKENGLEVIICHNNKKEKSPDIDFELAVLEVAVGVFGNLSEEEVKKMPGAKAIDSMEAVDKVFTKALKEYKGASRSNYKTEFGTLDFIKKPQ